VLLKLRSKALYKCDDDYYYYNSGSEHANVFQWSVHAASRRTELDWTALRELALSSVHALWTVLTAAVSGDEIFMQMGRAGLLAGCVWVCWPASR